MKLNDKNKHTHSIFGIKCFITPLSTILDQTFLSNVHNDVTNALKVTFFFENYEFYQNIVNSTNICTPLQANTMFSIIYYIIVYLYKSSIDKITLNECLMWCYLIYNIEREVINIFLK